jgi:exosortase/archaeosortase family protein
MKVYKTNKFQQALFVGGASYILLLTLEPILSIPLRQISSMLAFVLLKIGSVDIQFNGTILSTKEFMFVCNGSVVMRGVLVLGAISAILFTQWSRRGFLLSCSGLLLLSLCTNAVRIVILIAIEISSGVAVEGLTHDLISLFTLFTSLVIFLFIIKKVPSRSTWQLRSYSRNYFTISLYIIIFLPFAITCLSAWKNSPLDRFAFIFFIIGVSMMAYLWRSLPCGSVSGKRPRSYYLLSQLLILAALFWGFHALWSLAFISLLLVFCLDSCGVLRKFIPAILVLSLSLPVSSDVINAVFTASDLGGSALTVTWLTKMLIILICLFLVFNKSRLDLSQKVLKLRLENHSRGLLWLALLWIIFLSPSYVIEGWIEENQKRPTYLMKVYSNDDHTC